MTLVGKAARAVVVDEHTPPNPSLIGATLSGKYRRETSRGELDALRDGPVMVPQQAYDEGLAQGLDMAGYAPIKLIPKASSRTKPEPPVVTYRPAQPKPGKYTPGNGKNPRGQPLRNCDAKGANPKSFLKRFPEHAVEQAKAGLPVNFKLAQMIGARKVATGG